MTIKSQISKAINFFNPLNLDNRGGLLIPINLKIRDKDYYKYRHLKMNSYINSLTSADLPQEFSPKAVRLVDVFRRKTVDLDYEVMLIFDYITAEVIYCFVNDVGDGNEVYGDVDESIFKGKNIASIHNHHRYFNSPPSPKNFQILELEFEEYELIVSKRDLWVLESKDIIPDNDILEIKYNIGKLFYFSQSKIIEEFDEDLVEKRNELYGNLLIDYISNLKFSISLERKVLN